MIVNLLCFAFRDGTTDAQRQGRSYLWITWTSTRCPGRMPATRTRGCQAVRPAVGSAAACTRSRPGGTGARESSGAATYSAYAPWGGSTAPWTASPVRNRPARSPTAATTPARSRPSVKGGSPNRPTSPDRRFQSAGLTPAAWTPLRALERDGLVSRTVYPTVPPRVEYGLTALGREAGRLTSAIADWSMDHARQILAARRDFDERSATDPAPVR